MPLTLSIQKDKNLSSDTYEFFMLRLTGINDETTVEQVLSILLTLPCSPNQLVLNPESFELQPKRDGSVFYYLMPTLRLNTLFGVQASFVQQMHFLNVMGLTDKIERRPDLREAVEFFKFQNDLRKLGITNPDIPAPGSKLLSIKRIHLVHPEYLEDPEISAGLHVSIRKNLQDNQVFFVCNIQSLRMALDICHDNSTLIIDGHWSHGYAIDYGVWTGKNAQQISQEIKSLIEEFPGKISSIRLLGCHSGKLIQEDRLQTLNEGQFIFKDNVIPGFNQKEKYEFRNRAVYLSVLGETPFAENSLAGEIYDKIKDTSIRLTAPPALTYPYPSGVSVSHFNIGADSADWRMPPAWDIVQASDLPWFMKLYCLKSITIIKASQTVHEIDPYTSWLMKR